MKTRFYIRDPEACRYYQATGYGKGGTQHHFWTPLKDWARAFPTEAAARKMIAKRLDATRVIVVREGGESE